jgi:hypothetical protein
MVDLIAKVDVGDPYENVPTALLMELILFLREFSE